MKHLFALALPYVWYAGTVILIIIAVRYRARLSVVEGACEGLHRKVFDLEGLMQSADSEYCQLAAAERQHKSDLDAAFGQIAILTETQAAYYAMKADVDEIALFLRHNYVHEIEQGGHNGRSLAAIVTGYLGIERRTTIEGATK